MKTSVLVTVCAILLAAAGGIAFYLWHELEGVSLGFHGWLALALGVGLSVLVGVGLMALLFFSARRGYDDAASPGAAPPGGGDERDRAPERGDDAQR